MLSCTPRVLKPKVWCKRVVYEWITRVYELLEIIGKTVCVFLGPGVGRGASTKEECILSKDVSEQSVTRHSYAKWYENLQFSDVKS